MSTSSWGRELKYEINQKYPTGLSSTSSWGRELKYLCRYRQYPLWRRPPREVVSWNFPFVCRSLEHRRRPPREVVSWNMSSSDKSLVPSSTSSWGRELKYYKVLHHYCQRQSTSSWGRELKFIFFVILKFSIWSTSSWGRELKYCCYCYSCCCLLSTSSWGRELKWHSQLDSIRIDRRPPREVVSWNFENISEVYFWLRRPPREVVSWNTECCCCCRKAAKSTSSWGRELK